MTALSSATIGSGARAWSAARSSSRRAGKRLLDELDPEAHQLGQQARGVLRRPARVGVDPDRAAVHRADRLERLEVGRAAELDLERREAGRAGSPLGDDRRLVDADREVGRRDVRREAEQLVDRHAGDLAGQVVERDVERALGRAVMARSRPSMAPRRRRPAPRERRRSDARRPPRAGSGRTAAIVSTVSP